MKKRIIAAIVAASMIMTVAGCSKTKTITVDSFSKAAESLGCDEVDPEDFEEDFTDDLEDGIYTVIDRDYIEDNEDNLEYSLKSYGLDDIIDVDDVEGMAMLMKGSGFDDLEDIDDPDDIEDLKVDFAVVVTIELNNKIDVEDVMDELADKLDDADIEVDDLPSNEFYSSASAGYFRENIDIKDAVSIILDNDDVQDLLDAMDDSDDLTDVLEALSGQACIDFEVSQKSITVAVGFGINSDASTLAAACNKLGLKNVTSFKTNSDLVEAVIDTVVKYYGSYAYYY